MADKLNFPSIKGDPMPPPTLSMDEYLEFIMSNLTLFVDWRERMDKRENEIRRMVHTPFKIPPH